MAAKSKKSSGGSGDEPRQGQPPDPPVSDPNPLSQPMADLTSRPQGTPQERADNTQSVKQPAVVPSDHLHDTGPIAPPDRLESPYEQPITRTDPHRALAPEEDSEAFNEFRTTDEHFDLHGAHGPEGERRHAVAFRPVPAWVYAAGALLLVWSGVYLGQYSGGWEGNVFNEAVNYHPRSGPPEDPNSPEAMARAGQKIYTVNCVQCHQSSGLGQPGQFPPLVGSEWVVGDAPKRLTQILLHGIQGPIHVKGEVYNNAMPAWMGVLSDKQIAQVLTYIRTKLGGNSASPITEQQIKDAHQLTAGRSDQWSEAELLAIPPGPLEGGAAAPATGNQPPPGQNPPQAEGATKPAAAPLGQGPQPTPAPTPAP